MARLFRTALMISATWALYRMIRDQQDRRALLALAPADATFLADVAQDHQEVIRMGHLALVRSSDPAVRHYGQQVIDEHGDNLRRVQQLAGRYGVPLAAGISDRARDLELRLAGLTGAAFDRAFLEAMILEHERDIGMCQTKGGQAQHGPVRAYAGATIPLIDRHLRLARALLGQRHRTEARTPV